MAESVRCPSCGASNAAGSAWCSQCFARFDAPVPTSGPPTPVQRPSPEPSTPPPLAAVPSPSPTTGVRREGEALIWTCPSCESVNPIDASVCPVCATPMSAIFGANPKRAPLKRTSTAAIGWSIALPGAGHLYAGRTGDAVARIVLYCWTLGVGILLLTRHPKRGMSVVRGLGAVYVICAVGVWAIALVEAQRLARGDDSSLVPGRALLWASVALTMVLFVGLAVATQTR